MNKVIAALVAVVVIGVLVWHMNNKKTEVPTPAPEADAPAEVTEETDTDESETATTAASEEVSAPAPAPTPAPSAAPASTETSAAQQAAVASDLSDLDTLFDEDYDDSALDGAFEDNLDEAYGI